MITPKNSTTPDMLNLAKTQYQEVCVKALFLDMMAFVEKYKFDDFCLILDSQVYRINADIKSENEWKTFDEYVSNEDMDQLLLQKLETEFYKIESTYQKHLQYIIEYVVPENDEGLQNHWFHFKPSDYIECCQKFCHEKIATQIEQEYLNLVLDTPKTVKKNQKNKIKV